MQLLLAKETLFSKNKMDRTTPQSIRKKWFNDDKITLFDWTPSLNDISIKK